MSMFTLVICLTTSNLPWFVDLTFQVPMQYCSLQHWIGWNQMEVKRQRSPGEKDGRCCYLPSEKGQKRAKRQRMDWGSQGVGDQWELVNRDCSSLNRVSLSSSRLKNICGHTHAKHCRKGHDERDLAATTRNTLSVLGEKEINLRKLNYRLKESSSWV